MRCTIQISIQKIYIYNHRVSTFAADDERNTGTGDVKVTSVTVGAQMNDALEQFSLHNLRHVVGLADLYELVVLGGGVG